MPYAQILIIIFGFTKPQMARKICHLEMLNFFNRKMIQKVWPTVQEFGKLYKTFTPNACLIGTPPENNNINFKS